MTAGNGEGTPRPGPYDVAAVRARYPALADGHAYLDGAAGTQVPVSVIEAIAAAYREGIGNLGGAFAASARSDAIVAGARAAVADLVGGTPEGVVFGPSATALAYRISGALSRAWTAGDEVVVSRLDHDSNVRPWIQAAGRAGVTVKWAEVDQGSGELPAAQYADLIGPRTRVVAVTAASNAIGTMPDVTAIAGLAHEAGALLYVDGVHATPHVPVDVAALGADFYTTSAYKWSGPHLAALAADPGRLETVWPDKLAPSSNAVPWRFERGTLPFADLAGVTAAVEHLAALAPGAVFASGTVPAPGAPPASRRERITASMAAVEAYEAALFARLLG
ncbi:MAG: aminotransferase class V-fold PLP-dependent enzyme, partial [Trebonia sp.]